MGPGSTTATSAVAREGLAGGSASWAALGALLVVAAIGLLLRSFARRVGHRRAWVPALELAWWTVGALLLLRLALLPLVPSAGLAASIALLAVLAVAVVAGRELLAEAMAAVAIALSGRPRLGDAIAAAGHEGVVVAFGLTGVTLALDGGREVTVPNRALLGAPMERRAAAGAEALCSLRLPVPADLPAGRVIELARQAALLSAYASAHRRPEVRLVSDPEGRGPWLQMRGFTFDFAHRDDFTSDVLTRLDEGLARLRDEVAGGSPPPPRTGD